MSRGSRPFGAPGKWRVTGTRDCGQEAARPTARRSRPPCDAVSGGCSGAGCVRCTGCLLPARRRRSLQSEPSLSHANVRISCCLQTGTTLWKAAKPFPTRPEEHSEYLRGAAGAQVQQCGRGAGDAGERAQPQAACRGRAGAEVWVPRSGGSRQGHCCRAPSGAEAPAGSWPASGTRCHGSTRRPLLLPCGTIAGRPLLTFPSRPQGRCSVKNPVWVCRLASGRLLSASQRLPEPPGPPCLPAALRRGHAGSTVQSLPGQPSCRAACLKHRNTPGAAALSPFSNPGSKAKPAHFPLTPVPELSVQVPSSF